ncbi:hypothetical protein EsH8_VII_000825 [Colletotrichum jinshuiense]
MADPLSIAASVAGLITLAASTAKLAKAMTDRYTEQAAASTKSNVEALGNTLYEMSGDIKEGSFAGIKEEALRTSIESCTQTLREIETQFHKLDLEGTARPGAELSLTKIRRMVARPEALKEIKRLQASLEVQKTTLLIAMQ